MNIKTNEVCVIFNNRKLVNKHVNNRTLAKQAMTCLDN